MEKNNQIYRENFIDFSFFTLLSQIRYNIV